MLDIIIVITIIVNSTLDRTVQFHALCVLPDIFINDESNTLKPYARLEILFIVAVCPTVKATMESFNATVNDKRCAQTPKMPASVKIKQCPLPLLFYFSFPCCTAPNMDPVATLLGFLFVSTATISTLWLFPFAFIVRPFCMRLCLPRITKKDDGEESNKASLPSFDTAYAAVSKQCRLLAFSTVILTFKLGFTPSLMTSLVFCVSKLAVQAAMLLAYSSVKTLSIFALYPTVKPNESSHGKKEVINNHVLTLSGRDKLKPTRKCQDKPLLVGRFDPEADIIAQYLDKYGSKPLQKQYAEHMEHMVAYNRDFVMPTKRRTRVSQEDGACSSPRPSPSPDRSVCKLSQDVLVYISSMDGQVCDELQALASKLEHYASQV